MFMLKSKLYRATKIKPEYSMMLEISRETSSIRGSRRENFGQLRAAFYSTKNHFATGKINIEMSA